MTIDVVKQSDCYIIKHKAATLNPTEFDDSYSVLKDLVFRQKRRRIICDLSNVIDCTLTTSDFNEIKGAMFHLFINAPKNFRFGVIVKCESLAEKIHNCHSQIKEAGFSHWSFITESQSSAISALNCSS